MQTASIIQSPCLFCCKERQLWKKNVTRTPLCRTSFLVPLLHDPTGFQIIFPFYLWGSMQLLHEQWFAFQMDFVLSHSCPLVHSGYNSHTLPRVACSVCRHQHPNSCCYHYWSVSNPWTVCWLSRHHNTAAATWLQGTIKASAFILFDGVRGSAVVWPVKMTSPHREFYCGGCCRGLLPGTPTSSFWHPCLWVWLFLFQRL